MGIYRAFEIEIASRDAEHFEIEVSFEGADETIERRFVVCLPPSYLDLLPPEDETRRGRHAGSAPRQARAGPVRRCPHCVSRPSDLACKPIRVRKGRRHGDLCPRPPARGAEAVPDGEEDMRKYVILRKPAATRGGRNLRNLEALGTGRAPMFAYERLTDRAAASIAAEPEVEAVAPAMPTRLIRPLNTSVAPSTDVWGLDAVGALTSAFSGRGVTVAVLDTGIDADHPAFVGVDLVQKDFSGAGDGDRQGHGTHCAGTIFGRDVDGVRIGVARGVERALIGKVLDDKGHGDTEMIVDAVQWAVSNRADIISMSLGFDFPGMVDEWIADKWPPDLATSNALEAYRVNLRVLDAVMDLTRARGGLGGGTLVVAASGNESQREKHPEWRIAASLPAAAEDVVSVAAVGRRGERFGVANFSNSMALVSAPGEDIVSAMAGGRGLRALSGTSMACPHVAGVAALWWEAIRSDGRTPTPTNVKAQLIAKTRRDVFDDPAEVDIGQGLVTAP